MKLSYTNVAGTRIKLTDISSIVYGSAEPALEDEFEKKISEFWKVLIQKNSDHGIGEVKAMKELLINQIDNLDKDRSKLMDELAENMKFMLALNKSRVFLKRKLDIIEGFLAIYALQGVVEVSDKEKFNLYEKTHLGYAIESVSLAISKSEQSDNKVETIRAFLTAYYYFKETSLGLKKIRNFVIDENSNQTVVNQLRETGNSTLNHWKNKLEEKIDQIKQDSLLFEQKEDD